MGATVAELQGRMDAAEFAEWLAYYRLEPFGDDWDQAATVAAAAVQPHTRKPIDRRIFKPRAPRKKQSVEEITHRLNAWRKMYERSQKRTKKG